MMVTPQAAPQSGAPGAAPGAAPSTVVCIASQPDGTFMVYSQDQGPDAGQPAPDVDSAADMAKQLLGGAAGGSGAPGAASSANDDADALFQSGFNKARGNPLNRGDGDHEYR